MRLKFLAAIAFAAAAPTLGAQRVTGDRAGILRSNLVSANPIGLLFEWYNGEFEHALTNTVSLALAASSFTPDFDTDDESRYSVVDGIVRYYPAARAVRGFSVGASVGIVNYDENYDCFDVCYDNSGTAGTIGIRGDYVWIIGRDQHFAAAAAIGAKRVFGNDIGTVGLPIGRLSIGYAW